MNPEIVVIAKIATISKIPEIACVNCGYSGAANLLGSPERGILNLYSLLASVLNPTSVVIAIFFQLSSVLLILFPLHHRVFIHTV